jgi:aminopeptidase
MKSSSQLILAAQCAALFLTAALPPSRGAEKPDYKAIAERIVGQSANVKQGDRVVIRGELRDIDFVEELSLAVARRGAEPLQVLGREKAALRFVQEVPASLDQLPLGFSLQLATVETVEIGISGAEFPGLLSAVAPERLAAGQKRFNDITLARLARGVRSVDIGNGMYPTDATAKRHGMSKAQLAEIYWSGINVDYTKLQATGAALQARLGAAKEAHITHANGTDLTVQIKGKPVYVSDGVISPEDIAKGGPNLQVWLPAGEAYVVPVVGSAEGKIVVDRLPFDDGEILQLIFTVKGGKLVSHTARPSASYERWKARYAAAPDSKNEFGLFDLGFNPNVKVPAGSKLTTWVPAGTVSLAFGNNVWAGGTNNTPWDTAVSLNGCTVTLDGQTVVQKGVLQAR